MTTCSDSPGSASSLPTRQPVDLTAVVTRCAQHAQVADPGRPWQVRIAGGLTVTGDEELLRRAIDNLLMNVLVHTPAGTAGAISASAADGCIIIEVTDEGPGVPPDHLPHIFERFYRAGTRPGASISGVPISNATGDRQPTITADSDRCSGHNGR